MITPEQRRNMEANWGAEERALAATGRMMKGAILVLLVLTLAWIGASNEGFDPGQSASNANSAPSVQVGQRSAM